MGEREAVRWLIQCAFGVALTFSSFLGAFWFYQVNGEIKTLSVQVGKIELQNTTQIGDLKLKLAGLEAQNTSTNERLLSALSQLGSLRRTVEFGNAPFGEQAGTR